MNGIIANADPFIVGDFLFNPVVLLVAAGRAVAQVQNDISTFMMSDSISSSILRLFISSLLLDPWSSLHSISIPTSDHQRKKQKVSKEKTIYLVSNVTYHWHTKIYFLATLGLLKTGDYYGEYYGRPELYYDTDDYGYNTDWSAISQVRAIQPDAERPGFGLMLQEAMNTIIDSI